jgi:hypothetical protein
MERIAAAHSAAFIARTCKGQEASLLLDAKAPHAL